MGILAGAGPIGKALMQIKLLQPYQYRRIEAWLNPELDPEGKSFQVLQGLYAIGSGGLFGQGLGQSIQKLGFLPESQNDMIFAIICEELGLFGAISIILVFLFMIFRFMVIANNAPDLLELFSSGCYGAHCHSGSFKYCRSNQYHSQYRYHPSFYQLWRYIGVVYHDGNGNCFKRIQPDPAGKIRVRNQLAMHISSHQGI